MIVHMNNGLIVEVGAGKEYINTLYFRVYDKGHRVGRFVVTITPIPDSEPIVKYHP